MESRIKERPTVTFGHIPLRPRFITSTFASDTLSFKTQMRPSIAATLARHLRSSSQSPCASARFTFQCLNRGTSAAFGASGG